MAVVLMEEEDRGQAEAKMRESKSRQRKEQKEGEAGWESEECDQCRRKLWDWNLVVVDGDDDGPVEFTEPERHTTPHRNGIATCSHNHT